MHLFFSSKKKELLGFFGIGASIRIGQEIQCLQYAGLIFF